MEGDQTYALGDPIPENIGPETIHKSTAAPGARGVATWLPRTSSPDGTQRNQQEQDRDRNPAEDLQVGAV